MRRLWYAAIVLALGGPWQAWGASIVLDLGTAQLLVDESGAMEALVLSDGTRWEQGNRPLMSLETAEGLRVAQAARLVGDRLYVTFAKGETLEWSLVRQPGVLLLRRVGGTLGAAVERLRLFQLAVPAEAEFGGVLNSALAGPWRAAVMAAEPNVHAWSERSDASASDRPGCQHEFVAVDEAKQGRRAARFSATCDATPGGWSMRGRKFPRPLDLTGLKALRAWVHGDGKGQQLKIQLYDGRGGYRDTYIPITFTGWQQVTVAQSPLDTLRPQHVQGINFYYNGLPAGQSVQCLIDGVEALGQREGKPWSVLLEDFESPHSPLFMPFGRLLCVETLRRYGHQPAAFGLVVAGRDDFFAAVERFEQAAGLPSPRPGGVWNKRSPWVKRSYFFLTDFREQQLDEALSLARRGGFHTILIGQESWCRSTGHYEVNRDRFPQGLEGLKQTVQRFHEAGFRVGLHFLAPSIYPPDPYLTPVPDPRLVKGAAATLAAEVDLKAEFLPTLEAPQDFPAEDGGYEGQGTVLQVGEELIWYARRSLEPPFGFAQCRRGYLGTRPAPHRKGESIRHLVRSYGYHMFDMDTTLLDEVTTHFARVANACAIDMIYFDGSERLQGDHWYYNARLQKAFYDKLANKDLLLQGSSYSHYSWHLMARSASADGHGDLKGYLDQRATWFDALARDGMPLDIGWYYGYDPDATADQFEYILGATLAYDASMSFQVSVAAAQRQPFTPEILDLISRYERLRLSGRVPAEMRARLRVDPQLAGKKPEEQGPFLHLRREYRLLGPEGKEVFQRVVYTPWREIRSADELSTPWSLRVEQGPVRLGLQVHARSGPWLEAGPAYRSPQARVLEAFDDLAPYASTGQGRSGLREIGPGQGGTTLAGVTQRITLEAGGPEGKSFARYRATSRRPTPDGWSVIGKNFHPPLDLSWHRGLGFWLCGDGKGGLFKLQLTDGKRAMDYYIANKYVGWRYQQLARPEKDAIDYSRVRSLMFYYNGLPAKTEVACGIDDVKALGQLDQPQVVDPWVEVGAKRLAWRGSLLAGQYLVLWPGEPAARYGSPLPAPDKSGPQVPNVELPPGEHAVRFGLGEPATLPLRVRLTLQLPEQHAVP